MRARPPLAPPPDTMINDRPPFALYSLTRDRNLCPSKVASPGRHSNGSRIDSSAGDHYYLSSPAVISRYYSLLMIGLGPIWILSKYTGRPSENGNSRTRKTVAFNNALWWSDLFKRFTKTVYLQRAPGRYTPINSDIKPEFLCRNDTFTFVYRFYLNPQFIYLGRKRQELCFGSLKSVNIFFFFFFISEIRSWLQRVVTTGAATYKS